ncbi:MAG: mannose-1-phosphate guanylyltransferase, partial [Verrucomicrobiota bacterium]
MHSSQPKIYALILAGGSGTRFWPLSRNVRPKQLLNLFDEETLIEKAVNRLDGLVPPEQVLVLTNEVQREGVIKALPSLPPENIVAEPARRDTAPAIALAAGWIAARDPEAIMIALPADQLVVKEEAFRQVLEASAKAAADQDAIVTLGIKPTWACPGYGYIERGEKVSALDLPHGFVAHDVVRFREKPSPQVAAEYVAAGSFSWNAGIFIWSIPTVVRELTAHCPPLAAFVGELESAKDFHGTVAEKFPGLDKISIDYALMENAENILNIEADV